MTTRKNILFICHDGALYGAQQSLLLLLQNLSQENYHFYVSLARSGELHKLLSEIPGVTVLSHNRLQWVKHDARTLQEHLKDCFGLLGALLPRTFKLYQLIKQHQIDLVHTNSIVSLEGPLAAWLAAVPNIWHIRELFMLENPKLHMTLGRTFSRWLIHKLADRVFCISRAVQKQFQPYLPQSDKYRVIYNAIALPKQPASTTTPTAELPEKKGFRIGYVGRLSEGKRFHDLLQAFSRLKERAGIESELLVAGTFVDESFRQTVEHLLDDYKVRDKVYFIGFQENLSAVYATLDLLVLPSLNEPFGRVIIEAMWHSVACVANTSGGIPEIISHGETGLLYPPKDTNALFELLVEAIRQPLLLDSITKKAKLMVEERFTIDKQIQIIDAQYKELFKQYYL